MSQNQPHPDAAIDAILTTELAACFPVHLYFRATDELPNQELNSYVDIKIESFGHDPPRSLNRRCGVCFLLEYCTTSNAPTCAFAAAAEQHNSFALKFREPDLQVNVILNVRPSLHLVRVHSRHLPLVRADGRLLLLGTFVGTFMTVPPSFLAYQYLPCRSLSTTTA